MDLAVYSVICERAIITASDVHVLRNGIAGNVNSLEVFYKYFGNYLPLNTSLLVF